MQTKVIQLSSKAFNKLCGKPFLLLNFDLFSTRGCLRFYSPKSEAREQGETDPPLGELIKESAGSSFYIEP